jgi:hypothetical protein
LCNKILLLSLSIDETVKIRIQGGKMKNTLLRVTMVALSVLVLVLSLAVSISAAGNGANNGSTGEGVGPGLENRWGQNSQAGQGQAGQCTCTASKGNIPVTALTEIEKTGLTYMREEEKLARDVYQVFYAKYQSRIFKNIAASEQKHMDAIKTLLDRYGVADPAEGKGAGEFTNPQLQALYDELIVRGSVSLSKAFEVGVAIEEQDIDDLKEAINNTTHTDIKKVYSNLLNGSLNHLKAFTSNLVK